MKTLQAFHAALMPALVLASIKPMLRPELAASSISGERLAAHITQFDQIARDHDGNRAVGTSGYNASMEYVLGILARYKDSMTTYVQPFMSYEDINHNASLTGPDGKEVRAQPFIFATSTPPQGVTAPLVALPVDDERGSACSEDQWSGREVRGRIALIKGWGCSSDQKLALAKQHGAAAVVIYGGIGYKLKRQNMGNLVPGLVVDSKVGEEWRDRLAANETLQVSLLVRYELSEHPSWNIISETKEGNPTSVVMLGAHLDSVRGSPGINDNASGASGLLEMAGAIQNYTGLVQKVRFAWWGAEEAGLDGSFYYVRSLPLEQLSHIRFYFNYDMIGSPNPVYQVLAVDNADEFGAGPLQQYLLGAGKPANVTNEHLMRTDARNFYYSSVPVSGISTSWSESADRCYHQACDGKDNVNLDAVKLVTQAGTHVAARFALSLEGLPVRKS